MDLRPIGVFDSGIGGLTVLKELLHQFPQERFTYLGDTARLPYGSKSPETIRRYSQQNMDFLIQKDVKALVIACNSASTQMQESEYQGLPLYNVITPGAETALAHSQSHRIGVLGTQATILSAAYEKKIKSLAPDAEVFSVACPLFVPLAEEGWVDDPITNLIVYRYLNLILPKSVDTIILGCTHYPILKESIAKVTGSGINLVDSGQAIASRLEKDFTEKRLQRSGQSQNIEINITDASGHFLNLANKILQPYKVDNYQVVSI